MHNGQPQWTRRVELIEKTLLEPLHWRKPRRVFVNSMSDTWNEKLMVGDITRIYATMALTPHITYQVLTKRAWRRREILTSNRQDFLDMVMSDMGAADVWFPESGLEWPLQLPLPNVWEGVSVEDAIRASRITDLQRTPAAVRFISYEPALEYVDFEPYFEQGGIDWLIMGGESGPGARPCNPEWFREAIKVCRKYNVAPFMKQFGAHINGDPSEFPTAIHEDGDGHRTFRLADPKGGDVREWPEWARVREMPEVRR
jgi:protein gp37